MPPIQVRNKKTGKVNTINWNQSRPPTREEILSLVDQDVAPPPLASRPQFGDEPEKSDSWLGWLGHIPGITETPKFITDAAKREGDKITTPRLEEPLWKTYGKGFMAGSQEGAASLMNVADIGSMIFPESKVASAALALRGTGNIQEGNYGRGALELASGGHGMLPKWGGSSPLPPWPAKKAPLALTERTTTAARYAVDESGVASDLTRPYSNVAGRPFNPRAVQGPSGTVDPVSGLVKMQRGPGGQFIPREKLPPPSVKSSELPVIDIPAEVQAAYKVGVREPRAVIPDVEAPGLGPGYTGARQTAADEVNWWNRKAPVSSPTDKAVRGGPTTAEYAGSPQARRIGETRDQFRARVAVENAAAKAEAAKTVGKGSTAAASVSGAQPGVAESFAQRLRRQFKGEEGMVDFTGKKGIPKKTDINEGLPTTKLKPGESLMDARRRLEKEQAALGNVPPPRRNIWTDETGAVAPGGLPPSKATGKAKTKDDLKKLASDAFDVFQTARTTSMLSGLAPIKSVGGNIGAHAIAALEKRSMKPIKELMNFPEHVDAIKRGWKLNANPQNLAGGTSNNQVLEGFEKMNIPARVMGAFDSAAQESLMRAGLSEKEAKELLLTSPNAFAQSLGLDTRKGKFVVPFTKTSANAFKQGITRAAKHPAIWGSAVGAGYAAGNETDDIKKLGLASAVMGPYQLPFLFGAALKVGPKALQGISPLPEWGISGSMLNPMKTFQEPGFVKAYTDVETPLWEPPDVPALEEYAPGMFGKRNVKKRRY
jgi:hypothetical protein